MKPLYRKVHSHFKLNGSGYTRDELREVAYSLIKEGEAYEAEIGEFLLDWLDDSPTLEVHTSGSTGKPKPITLQKQHMVNSTLATGEFFGLQAGDSALLCLPASYIAGKMMLVRAIVLGLELDCVSPSSKPLNDVVNSYDFGAMVPLQLENSMDDLGQIKTLIVGGAPISDAVRLKLRQREVQSLPTPSNQEALGTDFLTEVYETYGMTETITHIALKKLNVGLSGDAGQGQNTTENPDPAPPFVALPDVSLSTDSRNCLVIEAPKISDALIATNDVVNLISKTQFQWLGRYDNVINSGGVKLFPEQIEAKLRSVIASRFFVAGLPDKKLGQKLVLIVEGTPAAERNEADGLLQEIRSLHTLEKFEVPKELYRVASFQETDSGKIQRQKTVASLFE